MGQAASKQAGAKQKHGGDVIITVVRAAYADYDPRTGVIGEKGVIDEEDTRLDIEEALHHGDLRVVGEPLRGWAPYSYLVGLEDGSEYYLVG